MGSRPKNILIEAVLVAIIGGTLAFAANALSSRGLKLTRNYFPGSSHPSAPTRSAAQGGTNGAISASQSDAEATLERLRKNGLQIADDEKILSIFHDPRYEQGLVIIIDARKEEEYHQAHIPGAYFFYPMAPDKYLPEILPACVPAQEIVIYCHGGNCDFSEIVAGHLIQSNVPKEKIFIYANGMPGWQARRLPLESGERKSGQIVKAAQ